MKKLFTGRINRRNYLIGIVVYFLIALVAVIVSSLTLKAGLATAQLFGYFFGFLYIRLAVRRLHDIGYSGWYVLFIFIPVAFPLYLLLIGGQKQDNKYGTAPSQKIDFLAIF